MPSDQKLWPGPAAMPNLYRRGADDVYRAKDELISDTVESWSKGPTEEALNRKRATRRTTPLTPDEIAAAEKWGKEVLAPQLRARQSEV